MATEYFQYRTGFHLIKGFTSVPKNTERIPNNKPTTHLTLHCVHVSARVYTHTQARSYYLKRIFSLFSHHIKVFCSHIYLSAI
jgi:hypothetical protein